MQAEEEIMQLALALSASEVVKTPEELRAEARLNEKCEQAGFEKVPIYGDGNCLFQSVATLLGAGATKTGLRESAVALVRQGEVASHLVGGLDGGNWCETMARDGVYGDELAVHALAQLTGRRIRVLSVVVEEALTYSPSTACDDPVPLWLRYDSHPHRPHYDALRPRAEAAPEYWLVLVSIG
jgi:hypothetical protein